jgi:hypothetical protein
MSTPSGPYRVERVETPLGPRCRLAGPGLKEGKTYPWDEVCEKLREMAELMNFAWHQALIAETARVQRGPEIE